MDSPKGFLSSFAFGPFEADLASGELRKHGARVKIQDLPLRLMSLLAEKPGQVVTREELQSRLWPEDTFVDFEDGINTGVKKLREALGDDPEKPRYIETIPRRGYRFIAKVRHISAPYRVAVAVDELPSSRSVHEPVAAIGVPRTRWKTWLLGALAAVVLFSALGFWLLYGRPAFSFNQRETVLVADFENQTGDTRFDEALRTAFIVSLEQSRHANVFPANSSRHCSQAHGQVQHGTRDSRLRTRDLPAREYSWADRREHHTHRPGVRAFRTIN